MQAAINVHGRWAHRSLLDQRRFVQLAWLAEITQPLPIAEIGIGDGGTLLALADLFPDREIHGYDTFEGLPSPIQSWESAHLCVGRFAPQPDLVGLLHARGVHLHSGVFPWSLSAGEPSGKFGCVHLDCDTYLSTRGALVAVLVRMNGYIVLDDFGRPEAPGVERAVKEVLGNLEHMRHTLHKDDYQLILEVRP